MRNLVRKFELELECTQYDQQFVCKQITTQSHFCIHRYRSCVDRWDSQISCTKLYNFASSIQISFHLFMTCVINCESIANSMIEENSYRGSKFSNCWQQELHLPTRCIAGKFPEQGKFILCPILTASGRVCYFNRIAQLVWLINLVWRLVSRNHEKLYHGFIRDKTHHFALWK